MLLGVILRKHQPNQSQNETKEYEMKTIAMSLLSAFVSVNAMASVNCFVQVAGETKPLQATKAGSVVLEAAIGNIEAIALVSLDSTDEVTDLQIKDTTQNFRVMGVGAYDLTKRPAVLFVNVGNARVSLTCSK
ncbi:hypothetical protein D3C87_1484530 [compost metagenome]